MVSLTAAPPLPVPSVESRPFWEACRRHELRLQRCHRCGRFWFPPASLCQHCWSREWSWDQLAGRGRVVSFVVYRRIYHDAFRGLLPYAVAVINLDEGVRFASRLVQVQPDEIHSGMEVEVVFEPVTEDAVLPVFRPPPQGGQL